MIFIPSLTMKQKDLEIILQKVPFYERPNPFIEQYMTPANIAADIIFIAFRFGDMRYKKGNLTTIPYSYDSETDDYNIDTDVLDNLIDFLNNNTIKVLRNSAGESMQVITLNSGYKYFDKIQSQPYKVSFEYVQVGD